MKILLISLLLATYSYSQQVESGVGNGGDGLILDNKLYLVDLVENGVHINPHFNTSSTPHQDTLNQLDKISNDKMSERVKSLVARKMQEVFSVSDKFGRTLLSALKFYRWVWLDLELVNIKDGDYIVNYNEERLVQLAVRREKVIRIDQNNWKKLDDENKAALIFHELLYATIIPEKSGTNAYQNVQTVRDTVGLIFSEDFQSFDSNDLSELFRRPHEYIYYIRGKGYYSRVSWFVLSGQGCEEATHKVVGRKNTFLFVHFNGECNEDSSKDLNKLDSQKNNKE